MDKNHIEKRKFHASKEMIDINVHIEHIVVLKKYPIGQKCFKYFIGCINYSDGDAKSIQLKQSKLNGTIKLFKKVK